MLPKVIFAMLSAISVFQSTATSFNYCSYETFKNHPCPLITESDEDMKYNCTVHNIKRCKQYKTMKRYPKKEKMPILRYFNIYGYIVEDGPYKNEMRTTLNFSISLPRGEILPLTRAVLVDVWDYDIDYKKKGICRLFEFPDAKFTERSKPALINYPCYWIPSAGPGLMYYLNISSYHPFFREIVYHIKIGDPVTTALVVAPIHQFRTIHALLGVLPSGNSRFLLTNLQTFNNVTIYSKCHSAMFKDLEPGDYKVMVFSDHFVYGNESLIVHLDDIPTEIPKYVIFVVLFVLLVSIAIAVCIFLKRCLKYIYIDQSHICSVTLWASSQNPKNIISSLKKLFKDDFQWMVTVSTDLEICQCQSQNENIIIYVAPPEPEPEDLTEFFCDCLTPKAVLFYRHKTSVPNQFRNVPLFNISKDIRKLFNFIYTVNKKRIGYSLFKENTLSPVYNIYKSSNWKILREMIKIGSCTNSTDEICSMLEYSEDSSSQILSTSSYSCNVV